MHSLWIIGIFLAVIGASTVSSLKCYHCNHSSQSGGVSEGDVNCNSTSPVQLEIYKKDCDAEDDRCTAFMTERNGLSYISRRCADTDLEELLEVGCNDRGFGVMDCNCITDFCNTNGFRGLADFISISK